MIKIRLHGTPEEIKKTLDYLTEKEKAGEIEILDRSGLYANRGASRYATYMDVEIKEKK